MKDILYYKIVLILFLLIGISCQEEQSEEAKQAIIEEEVQRRVERLVMTKYERCQTELLGQASIIVDSILIARAKAQKDTITKPGKPIKPEKPDVFLLEEDFSVKPLVRDSSMEKENLNIE